MDTTTEVVVQWQMNRTRDAHVLKRFMAAEHFDCFVSPLEFYHLFPIVGAFLAQPGRFSHGRRGRDLRYARTINAQHGS